MFTYYKCGMTDYAVIYPSRAFTLGKETGFCLLFKNLFTELSNMRRHH